MNPQDDHVWKLGRAPKYPLENVNFGPEKASTEEILEVEVLTFPSNAPELGAPRGPNFVCLYASWVRQKSLL